MDQLDCTEVVLTEDLAPLLERVLSKRLQAWEAGGSNDHPLGPYGLLAHESGVPERRIYGILKGEQVSVDLDVADRLCLALDLFIELELPESSIYKASEVRAATREQTAMLFEWAEKRGIPIPPLGTPQRRLFGGQMRMLAQRERAA